MDTTGRIGEKVRKKTKGKPYLPDDIIPNILCRLPAKNASQCLLLTFLSCFFLLFPSFNLLILHLRFFSRKRRNKTCFSQQRKDWCIDKGDWKKKAIDLAEGCARKGLKATKQELQNGFKAILELLKQGTCVGPKEVETGEPSSCGKKKEKFADKGKGKTKVVVKEKRKS